MRRKSKSISYSVANAGKGWAGTAGKSFIFRPEKSYKHRKVDDGNVAFKLAVAHVSDRSNPLAVKSKFVRYSLLNRCLDPIAIAKLKVHCDPKHNCYRIESQQNMFMLM
jgi:hypothetical protein